MSTTSERKIIHIDMDAFYASVEQRDDPSLRGRPVVVGGLPGGRGVVATASYEARKFGIRSAMPTATAFRLCPKAIFIKPSFAKYKEASASVMGILKHYCQQIESVSLDEAYLDATENRYHVASGGILAKAIQEHIYFETKLTASAGVGPNKYIAKIASDYNKPSGLTVVAPNHVDAFLSPLSVSKLPGVGKSTSARLKEMGVLRISDLIALSEQDLTQAFGSFGKAMYQMARGIDTRAVKPSRPRKTVSAENTFSKNLTTTAELGNQIEKLSEEVFDRLTQKNLFGRTVNFKIKFSDFTTATRSQTLERSIEDAAELASIASGLLKNTPLHSSVRLLGVGISSLSPIKEEPLVKGNGIIQLSFPFTTIAPKPERIGSSSSALLD